MKKYIEDGDVVFCDGCFLMIVDGRLVFNELSYDGGLYYDGNTVEYDPNEDRHFTEEDAE